MRLVNLWYIAFASTKKDEKGKKNDNFLFILMPKIIAKEWKQIIMRMNRNCTAIEANRRQLSAKGERPGDREKSLNRRTNQDAKAFSAYHRYIDNGNEMRFSCELLWFADDCNCHIGCVHTKQHSMAKTHFVRTLYNMFRWISSLRFALILQQIQNNSWSDYVAYLYLD